MKVICKDCTCLIIDICNGLIFVKCRHPGKRWLWQLKGFVIKFLFLSAVPSFVTHWHWGFWVQEETSNGDYFWKNQPSLEKHISLPPICTLSTCWRNLLLRHAKILLRVNITTTFKEVQNILANWEDIIVVCPSIMWNCFINWSQ